MEHVKQEFNQMEITQSNIEPVQLSVNNDLTAHLPKVNIIKIILLT